MNWRSRWLVLVLVGAIALIVGCASKLPDWYDPAKAHHRPDGFVNTDGLSTNKAFTDLIRWRWKAWRGGLPPAPSRVYKGYADIPVVKPDLQLLADPGRDPIATWLGHATVLLQMGGVNILTDPHFGRRASPVSFAGPERKVPNPLSLKELPRIDVVVISHNHYDHLDEETVLGLTRQPGGPPLFLVPLGVDQWFKALGVGNVKALDWWDKTASGAVAIEFVPVQHWSARSLSDRNQTLWGGWVLRAGETSVFFAGDTGYSRDFARIGARFGGFDLALIPVGAYEPRWFMKAQHVNPDEAVLVHLDIKARRTVGIHWGTFELTDEALDQPILDLAKAIKRYELKPDEFVLLQHGQTIEIEP